MSDNRARARRQKYNTTDEDYESMMLVQEGLCAICNQPELRKRRDGTDCPLVVDHCHRTGRIRALLCSGCNLGIGHFREDVDVMREAIAYLQLHTSIPEC